MLLRDQKYRKRVKNSPLGESIRCAGEIKSNIDKKPDWQRYIKNLYSDEILSTLSSIILSLSEITVEGRGVFQVAEKNKIKVSEVAE